MTEYDEICWNKCFDELLRELLWQLGLGYSMGDSFPSYILHLMDRRE